MKDEKKGNVANTRHSISNIRNIVLSRKGHWGNIQ